MSCIGVLESSSFTQIHTSTVPADLTRLEEMLKCLEHESARSWVTEGEAIGFHRLGFKSKIESNTWLVLNTPID